MITKKILGWLTILLALFSLAPSLVPGAMSLIGLAIALPSLVLSLFSIGGDGKAYFHITAVIVVAGIILVNDTLRLFDSLPETPVAFKFVMYVISGLMVLGCFLAANKLHGEGKKHNNE